jgi:hypothetical protein
LTELFRIQRELCVPSALTWRIHGISHAVYLRLFRYFK